MRLSDLGADVLRIERIGDFGYGSLCLVTRTLAAVFVSRSRDDWLAMAGSR